MGSGLRFRSWSTAARADEILRSFCRCRQSLSEARGAASSIKPGVKRSETPGRRWLKTFQARGAAASIKPGVKRGFVSGTPGDRCEKYIKPAERPADESSRLRFGNCDRCRPLRGLRKFCVLAILGFRFRFTPG